MPLFRPVLVRENTNLGLKRVRIDGEIETSRVWEGINGLLGYISSLAYFVLTHHLIKESWISTSYTRYEVV